MFRPLILSFVVCLAVLLLPVFATRLMAQKVLDARIDSLQKLIARTPPDKSKVDLYLQLISSYKDRYTSQNRTSSDSLAVFRTSEACQVLSKKLNYAYGLGSCYLEESGFYSDLKNLPKQNERIQQAISVFHDANNKEGLAAAYLAKAFIHPISNITTKLSLYDTALQLAREVKDIIKETRILSVIADLHQQQGKYELAIKELLSLLELQKRMGIKETHYTTDLLSHVFSSTGNHKESLRYAIATLDDCRKNNDTLYIITFYQRLASNFVALYNYEKAFYYYGKALASYGKDLASLVPDNTAIIALIYNMTYCLIKQQKYQEAYNFLYDRLKIYPATTVNSTYYVNRSYMDLYYFTGQFREAEKYLSKILQNSAGDYLSFDTRVALYTRAGQLYFHLKQFDKAARYSDSAQILAVRLNSWPWRAENNLTLFKLDSVHGNYLSAIKHYQGYKTFSDSVQKDVTGKQTAELAVQYETDQKNTALELLNNKTRLQQKAIQQGTFLRNTMIAGSALLLTLFLVIVNRYRLKQRANRLLEEKQKEKDKLLTEKEWLLKEIHHRVKNNLQIVMSLLNTQSAFIDDEPALAAIHDSRHRVYAMSLIHQKLYNTENVSSINISLYISELVCYLADSFNVGQRIRFESNIEPLEMDVSQSVPLGLILNEAITNSIKYAFPGGKQGIIFISLARTAPDRCLLTVSDNGIGMPAAVNDKKPGSMGMSMMKGLSRDLDGQFSIETKNGVTIKISFAYKPGVKHHGILIAPLVSNN